MLAQNFKPATDLGITEGQADALRKTLVLLETGKLTHVEVSEGGVDDEDPTFCGNFNMRFWKSAHRCGTAACIGGTAQLIGNVDFGGWMKNPNLNDLFWPPDMKPRDLQNITPAQAATALRSYLTTGDARWDLAVA